LSQKAYSVLWAGHFLAVALAGFYFGFTSVLISNYQFSRFSFVSSTFVLAVGQSLGQLSLVIIRRIFWSSMFFSSALFVVGCRAGG
jgi:hypothetical protein